MPVGAPKRINHAAEQARIKSLDRSIKLLYYWTIRCFFSHRRRTPQYGGSRAVIDVFSKQWSIVNAACRLFLFMVSVTSWLNIWKDHKDERWFDRAHKWNVRQRFADFFRKSVREKIQINLLVYPYSGLIHLTTREASTPKQYIYSFKVLKVPVLGVFSIYNTWL